MESQRKRGRLCGLVEGVGLGATRPSSSIRLSAREQQRREVKILEDLEGTRRENLARFTPQPEMPVCYPLPPWVEITAREADAIMERPKWAAERSAMKESVFTLDRLERLED